MFQNSDANKSDKKYIKNLPIYAYINNRARKYYGYATIVDSEDTESVKKYHLSLDDGLTLNFEDKECFFVLEICPKMHAESPNPDELKETVAHEFAHFLEMRKNGFDDRENCDNYHNDLWAYYARLLGCQKITKDKKTSISKRPSKDFC